MDIRIAKEEDLARIVEIYNQAVVQRNATADLTPVTVESRRGWFENHSAESWPIWVMEDGDGILGWCSVSPYRPGRMALRHTAEISYYVHKEHRRRGIGTALIEYAIAQCQSLQIKNLFTLLLDINVPSIGILEKSGFAKWGHMPDVAEIDDRHCGQLIYGRRV